MINESAAPGAFFISCIIAFLHYSIHARLNEEVGQAFPKVSFHTPLRCTTFGA